MNILAKAAVDQEGEQSTVEVPVAPESSQSADYIPASKYKGVSWYKQVRRWARRRSSRSSSRGLRRSVQFSFIPTDSCSVLSRETRTILIFVFCDVTLPTQGNKWLAKIYIDGKGVHLGLYDNEEDAARK